MQNNLQDLKQVFYPSSNDSKVLSSPQLFTLFGAGMSGSVAIAILGDRYLGEEFRNDAKTIVKVGNTPIGQRIGDEGSFAVIADFYRHLGMLQHPVAAMLFGVVLGALVIWIAVSKAGGLKRNIFSIGVFISAFALNGVFLGQFTKEVMISIAVLLVLAVPITWWGELLILGSLALLGAFFRQYWILILGIYLAIRWIPPSGLRVFGRRLSYRNPAIFISLIAICSCALSLAIAVFTGDGGDHFRTAVNQIRLSDDNTATLIPQYIKSSGIVGGSLNNLLTTVFIVFPVPLFVMLKPYYFASALLLFVLWSNLAVGYCKLRVGKDQLMQRAVALLVGFLIVQGVFEPDFGSVLRHLVPLVPLLILLRDKQIVDTAELGESERQFLGS